MMRTGSNKVIDSIFESGIHEGKQNITVISYKAKGVKYGMQVVNTSGLKKLKQLPGFTEIDSYAIPANDDAGRFFATIDDDITNYGLDRDNFSPDSPGVVLGKRNEVGFGYRINSDSKVKIHKYGVTD